MYPPEEVAHAILTCADKPVRDVVVGGVPRRQFAMAAVAPRLTDLMMEKQMWPKLESDEPAHRPDSLDRPSGEDYGRRHGRQAGRNVGLYTRAVLSDAMRAAPLLAVGAIAAGIAFARR